MTSLLINILISLIGLAIIVVALFSFLPNLEKILDDKLKNSLSRKSKDHGPLAQILYKYNHQDSRAWTEWILTQDAEAQDEALEKLIAHIDQSPSMWGSITGEVITALSKFGNKDHIKILKSVLNSAKKMWKKYMVCEACYAEALKGIIYIDNQEALNIIKHELEKIHENEAKEEQGMTIVNSLVEFPEDTDLKEIFHQIITDSNQATRVRNYAITVAEEANEEKAFAIFSESVKTFIETNNVLLPDDLKIFETLLNLSTKEINEESFSLILHSLVNPKLAYTVSKILGLILKSIYQQFTSEQLYMLTHTQNDEQGSIANIMASVFNLNAEEKVLIKYIDPQKEIPFKKAPINNEHLNKPLVVPEGFEDYYDKLKDLIKERTILKQSDVGGGIVLTGHSDEEKLLLCRILAAEKKYHFIYASFDDVIGSSTTAKSLHDMISTHKPCVVYLDDIDSIFKNLDPAFVKTFKHYFLDSTVNIIGTLNEEAEIDGNNSCVLFSRDDLKDLFPSAMEITTLSDAFKNRFLTNKINVLDLNRGQQSYESLNILEPTKEMGLLDFKKYITKYFKASLIIYGTLISSEDFEKLDSLAFDGKSEL